MMLCVGHEGRADWIYMLKMDFSFRNFPGCCLAYRDLFIFWAAIKLELACGNEESVCWRVINWMTWLAKCNNIYDPKKGCSPRAEKLRLLWWNEKEWEREKESRKSLFISFSSTPTALLLLLSHFNTIMISLYELFMWCARERIWWVAQLMCI